MTVRPYRPPDREALWALKAAFERELGAAGGDAKAASYAGKLTDAYRERYLDWVRRCVDDDPRCVTVAPVPEPAEGSAEAAEGRGASEAGAAAEADGTDPADATPDHDLAGYVFVLPERLAFVWDAAVVNEAYVRPAYRGTGLADELLEAALSVARDQDLPLDRVVLDVDRENERARAFYERHGFTHWGEMVARDL